MSKIYRYIQVFKIGDKVYLPGTMVEDELKGKKLDKAIKDGFVAEKKGAKKQEEPEVEDG